MTFKKIGIVFFLLLIILGIESYQYVVTLKEEVVSATSTIPNPGHPLSEIDSSSFSTKNLAQYKVDNLGGSGTSPELLIIEGYRSYHGLRLNIPSTTIVGNMTSTSWYDSSEATESATDWTYRYFYALASDTTKIAVSNNAPTSGNIKTINGREYVYIGAARYYNGQYASMTSSDNIIWFTDSLTGYSSPIGYNGYTSKGIVLFKTISTCSDSKTINLTNYLPSTASSISGIYSRFMKVRCDSGCWALITSSLTVGGSFFIVDREQPYILTPIGGNDYYPIPYQKITQFDIDANVYSLTSAIFSVSASTCYADGWSGHGAQIIKYKDSSIY